MLHVLCIASWFPFCDAESHFNDDTNEKREKLLLFKSPQNTKNSIKYCSHQEKKAIILTGVFWDIKLSVLPMNHQCDVPFVDDGDIQLVANILIGILIVLSPEAILCIVLVF